MLEQLVLRAKLHGSPHGTRSLFEKPERFQAPSLAE
uniref:Uncharacterized protein n=1 Tax=Peronospora matthiolae TaxID=2874970 RepID=A0AAV1VBS1_9STRA